MSVSVCVCSYMCMSVFVCVHVFMCVCFCVCMPVYMWHVCFCVYVCMFMCVRVHICVAFVCICLCVCMFVCMLFVCVFVCLYVCNVCEYACMCLQTPENNFSAWFSDAIYLVSWAKVSHWAAVCPVYLAGWPMSLGAPSNCLCFLSTRNFKPTAPHPALTWVLGVKLRLQCFQSKHLMAELSSLPPAPSARILRHKRTSF